MDLNGKEYVEYCKNYNNFHGERRFDTYEDALEDGLFEALLMINNVK